jgi:hypothetical protein
LQDLDAGDLVVTQDFKGAGLYAAVPDPETRPFMQLKKCGRDSAGAQHAAMLLLALARVQQHEAIVIICGA